MIAQLVDHAFLSAFINAWIAQSVERVHGKDEVTGSIPVSGSSIGGQAWQG